MYLRQLKSKLLEHFGSGKAIIVLGARQVGKTTLLKDFLSDKDHIFINGDIKRDRDKFTEPGLDDIKNIMQGKNTLFIDEAQRIPRIGLTLKIIIDTFPNINIMASGSSALDLSSAVNEPLTGRKWQYSLFPLSYKEILLNDGYLDNLDTMDSRLVYGSYPDVFKNSQPENYSILADLYDSYLFKDILSLSEIRKPDQLEKLLQALSYQVGNEVSYNELAQLLQVDRKTVEKYIEILIKGFVVFKLKPYNSNLRNELKSKNKIYFWDNGIRNIAIGDLSSFETRQDKGSLWENYIISERKKQLSYNHSYAQTYFWRSRTGQEVDYIEKKDGNIKAYEIKLNDKAKYRQPKLFNEAYNTTVEIISPENINDFLTDDNI